MFTLLAILGIVSVAGIAGSIVVSARDGYGRQPQGDVRAHRLGASRRPGHARAQGRCAGEGHPAGRPFVCPRRTRHLPRPGDSVCLGGEMADVSDRAILRRFLLGLAEGMNAAAETVDGIRDTMLAVSRAYGQDDTDILVFPTAIIVQTGSAEEGRRRIAFDAHPVVQVRPDRRAVRAARAGEAGGDRTGSRASGA